MQDVEAFAGGRSKTPYRKAYKYAEKGGKVEDWEHVKVLAGWIPRMDRAKPRFIGLNVPE